MTQHSPESKYPASELVPGKTYRVVAQFVDYHGQIHPVGETWRFTRKNFLPYEDGLSLFVEMNGKEIQIDLQWRAESQAEIIENFWTMVEVIS